MLGLLQPKSQHVGQLEQQSLRRHGSAAFIARAVHVLRKIEQHGERLRRVEVFVHRTGEPIAVRREVDAAVVKDQRWSVKQRRDYNANYQDIGDLLVKLPDLKVVQTENVGATLLPRLNLVQPGKDAKSADGAGTLLELSDKGGKVIGSLLLGKKVIKIEDSPLPIKQEIPVGRYVLSPGNPSVLVISDALKNAEANPAQWLAKDFFKAERIRSLTTSGEGAQWKIARDEEYGQWKFAAGGGQLDASAAVAAVNALASLAFADVAIERQTGKPG